MQKNEQIWQQRYLAAPKQLSKLKNIGTVIAAFNTNIDAVVKIRGDELSKLAEQFDLKIADIKNGVNQLCSVRDVVRGICKCFINGIAEEWLCQDAAIAEWMQKNLQYERLQMGGQAGIIANLAAVLGVKRAIVHTASHPKKQAEQFLHYKNLYAVDENAELQQASTMNRVNDDALIHYIIEFDKGECCTIEGQNFTAPRANRFIATYDPANMHLKINDGFIKYVDENGYDFLVLSGFHNLTAKNGGEERIGEIVPLIKNWREHYPSGVIHLELASTQDKVIRRVILEKIAPLVDSLGLNEREAIDAIEIIAPDYYKKNKNEVLEAALMTEILLKIKEKTQTPRIQLHMFGLYVTLQNADFRINVEQNRNGMLFAAVVAASKAGYGKIEKTEDLLWSNIQNINVPELAELQKLSECLNMPELLSEGIAKLGKYDIIAVPTLIVPKPLTLVGMGDTISSVSLVSAI